MFVASGNPTFLYVFAFVAIPFVFVLLCSLNILLFHISNRLFCNSEGVAPIVETIYTTYIYNVRKYTGKGYAERNRMQREA